MFSKFLDPKNDVAFKKIFGTEKNKDILIHFLNDMITFKTKKPIKEVSFLKTIQDPEIAAKKTSIVDILCEDENGNQYIVEMQVAKEKGFEKRAQYYASKAYSSQACVTGAYHDLNEVVFLAITDFVMFPQKKSFKSDHVILDRESLENDLKDFSFTFLELPKFNKSLDHLGNIVDKWTYFFKNAEETSEEDLSKIIGHDPIIARAYKELSRFSWNEAELLTYSQAEKYEGAYQASLAQKFDEGEKKGIEKGLQEGEKKGIEKGLQEGEKKGIEKGLQEGEKKGIEKGIQEGEKKAQLLIAANLLGRNFSPEQVCEFTGLEMDELPFSDYIWTD